MKTFANLDIIVRVYHPYVKLKRCVTINFPQKNYFFTIFHKKIIFIVKIKFLFHDKSHLGKYFFSGNREKKIFFVDFYRDTYFFTYEFFVLFCQLTWFVTLECGTGYLFGSEGMCGCWSENLFGSPWGPYQVKLSNYRTIIFYAVELQLD